MRGAGRGPTGAGRGPAAVRPDVASSSENAKNKELRGSRGRPEEKQGAGVRGGGPRSPRPGTGVSRAAAAPLAAGSARPPRLPPSLPRALALPAAAVAPV